MGRLEFYKYINFVRIHVNIPTCCQHSLIITHESCFADNVGDLLTVTGRSDMLTNLPNLFACLCFFY